MYNNVQKNNKFHKKQVFFCLFMFFFMIFLSLICFFKDKIIPFSNKEGGIKIHLILLGIFLFFLIFLLIFPRRTKKNLLHNRKIFLFESVIFILIALVSFIFPGLGMPLFGVKNNFFSIDNSIAIILIIYGLSNLYIDYFFNSPKRFHHFFINLIIFGLGMNLIGDHYQLEEKIFNILFFIFISSAFYYLILFFIKNFNH
ncbi:hypothetical protein ATP_00444 [Candidatus Phytoplasma mali]|uniref:Uncharacterized protein n=1 Tax=Phytoplasma mali (strain AT) TaxID=482235 RepID=B3R0P7_PHYMT|nr:hypothetical protein [Candidatus Phytoplasma mali]CAP18631.1 hypothetical protein ATP_00444 [Candidatus Phytoplasma mali]